MHSYTHSHARPKLRFDAGGKVIGSRDLARYYRQHPRPADERRSVQVNTMLAK